MPINGLARLLQINNLRYIIIVQQVGNFLTCYLSAGFSLFFEAYLPLALFVSGASSSGFWQGQGRPCYIPDALPVDLLGFRKLPICGTLSLFNKLATCSCFASAGFYLFFEAIQPQALFVSGASSSGFWQGQGRPCYIPDAHKWTCSASANYQFAVRDHCTTSWQLVPALPPQGFIFSSKLIFRWGV
jgi:hypothetical protein